jgi:hypothetical protein
VVLFGVIFGLLIFPWPGWNDLYGAYFRALGEAAFSRPSGPRIVLFEPHALQHGFSSLDTQMTLGNRDRIDQNGNGPAKKLSLDTRSIGWTPTALTIALILATPVPWRQRAWALLWGLLLIHAFILFSVQVWIWDKASEVSLATPPPFLQSVLDELEYTLLVQLGVSFSVPLLIWILVTFRRKDYALFSSQF